MAEVRLTCSPHSLGISEAGDDRSDVVKFHILASSDKSLDDLVVELWHKTGVDTDWTGIAFDRDGKDSGRSSATFVLYLPKKDYRRIDFTVRYKHTGNKHWHWISSDGRDGRYLPSSDQGPFRDISMSQMFHRYDEALQARQVTSNIADTQLIHLSITAPVKSPELTSVSLGKPVDLVQWISLERLMAFWMEPNQGRTLLNTPRDSFFVAYMREDGTHVVLLPISGLKDDCSVVLKTDEKTGNLVMHTKNDGQTEGTGLVILGRGRSLASAVDAVFASTRTLFQRDAFLTKEDCQEKQVDPQWFEDWTDGLFYCTWNAMYTDVTEQKILDAVGGLDKQGIKVNGVIIDDGWQDIDDRRRWQSFKPPTSKFPNGLRGTVELLKKRYPYIKHVGVWHALLGYWNGMSPDSSISQQYSMIPITMRKVNVPNGLEQIHAVDSNDIRRMYDDFYKYLSSEGITVVKCDVQGTPDDISHSFPEQRKIWRAYQDAFKLASEKYLSRKVIYCMSHVSNIYLHSLLQRNSFPACIRNSNDFFPDQPDSHAWHVFWNANNDLYTSRLNVLPDWDMFDTTHPQAALHAMARSLSGGPIMITDQANKSDAQLIAKMTSKSIGHAGTKVLRFQKPALCRYPYLNFNDGRFTKIINTTYDIISLGVFNTTKHRATEAVSLSDFGAAFGKSDYAVYEVETNSVRLATKNDLYEILFAPDLEANGSAMYTASPVLALPIHNNTEANEHSHKVAVLGLIDKFAGPVAVSYYRTSPSTHPSISLKLTHLGLLGVYVSFKPNLARMLVTMADIVVPAQSVTFRGEVLVVDVERAWRDMKIDESSNEVMVMIYFRD